MGFTPHGHSSSMPTADTSGCRRLSRTGRKSAECGYRSTLRRYSRPIQRMLCHKLPRWGLGGVRKLHFNKYRYLVKVDCDLRVDGRSWCPGGSGSAEVRLVAFLRGSSHIRAVFRWLVARMRDEEPHRNAKHAYLCALPPLLFCEGTLNTTLLPACKT